MGKDYLGADQRKVADDDKKDDKPIQALDEGDIALLKTYGKRLNLEVYGQQGGYLKGDFGSKFKIYIC